WVTSEPDDPPKDAAALRPAPPIALAREQQALVSPLAQLRCLALARYSLPRLAQARWQRGRRRPPFAAPPLLLACSASIQKPARKRAVGMTRRRRRIR